MTQDPNKPEPRKAALMAYSPDNPTGVMRHDPVKIVVWSGMNILRAVGAVAAILVAAGIVSIGVLPVFILALVALVVLLVVGARCIDAVRQRRVGLVMSYLHQAVRLNLPLPQMIAAACMAEHGAIRRRLNRLQLELVEGAPVGNALKVAVPEAPRRVTDLLDSAERNGSLPAVLRRLMDEQSRDVSADVVSSRAFQIAYVLIVPLGLALVIGMLMIFVMPKFQYIMKDFHIPVPGATRLVMDVANSAGPPLVLLLVISLLALCGRSFGQLFSGREGLDPLRWITDRVIWRLPIFGALTRNRGLSDVCNTVADGLEAGRPMHLAVMEANLPSLNAVLARRVERWSILASTGSDAAGAARLAGFPPLVSGMTSAAVYSGDLAAAMRFLGRYYDTRFSRLALLLRSAAMPIMAIVLGVMVTVVALSVFLPIISMVDDLLAKIYAHW